MKKDIFISILLISIAVLSRLISHQWNFTAIGAVAIVSSFVLNRKFLSLIVTFMALLISDSVLGFHNDILFVYLGFGLMTTVGYFFSKQKTNSMIFISSLAGSLLFFIVSNFGVWIEGSLYPLNFSGFLNCYQMAVPFFRNELVSNVLGSIAMFYLFGKIEVLLFNRVKV